MIQEHYVVSLRGNHFDSILTGGCLVRHDAVALHQAPGYFAVHVVIVHHEDRDIVREKIFLLFSPVHAFLKTIHEVADRICIYDLLREFKRKFRTMAVFALYLQRGSHEVKQAGHDGHAKPGALNVPILLLIQPRKGFKELLHILLSDSYTRIAYRHEHKELVVRHLFPGDHQRHFALFRVLNRVGQQVHDHLADAHVITEQRTGQRTVDLQHKVQSLVSGTLRYGIDQVVDHG